MDSSPPPERADLVRGRLPVLYSRPPRAQKQEEPSMRLRKYHKAVHDQWVDGYYGWIKSHLRGEAWVVAAGVLSPVAAAVAAWYLWPEKIPIPLWQVIIAAAVLGAIGGLTTFIVQLALLSLWHRATAPYRVWDKAQDTIREREEVNDFFGELLLPKRPVVVISLISETYSPNRTESFFLQIENRGERAELYAEIAVKGATIQARPGQKYAIWASEKEPRLKIPTLGRGLLLVAELIVYEENDHGRWNVYEWEEAPGASMLADETFKLSDPETHRKLTVTLTIYSDPPLVGGPRRIAVELRGRTAEMVENVGLQTEVNYAETRDGS